MKVLFLFDILKDSRRSESFSFCGTNSGNLIKTLIANECGYTKVGKSVQSHATIDSKDYVLFGGTTDHQELLAQFLDDHSTWKNLGMNYTAFHEYEKAVLLNSDSMHYDVWVLED